VAENDDADETEIWTPDDEGQLSAEDTLEDRGLDDALDEGYSPPERPRGLDAFGTTAAEQEQGESLDQRLRQEEPDPASDADLDAPRSRSDYDDDEARSEADEFFEDDQVGDERSGRLLAPDEGYMSDLEKDEVAEDAGIDGGAASAEEAAVHIIEP
jgi:hypothetical protein